MRSRREPERGGHERGRGKATKEGKVDAWESSALSGWCSTWHTGERKSRASIRLSFRAPLARGKFDLLAILYRLPMLILEHSGFR